jgi:cysteine desulfurase
MFGFFGKKAKKEYKKRIYLDYAAATPLRDEVFEAMRPYFADVFGNPSAIHEEGRRARKAVDDARATIARLLKIRAEEVTFTSGGTEANNLAIFGVVDAAVAQGKALREIEIISTAIEHPSVLQALEVLKSRGMTIHFAPVDEEGLIDT